MKNTLDDIKKIIKKDKSDIIKKYHIKKIGVFGSYIRGEQNDDSDIDILVEFEKPISMFKFLELEEYLENKIDIKVDLVTNNALKPNIGSNIRNEVVYI